MKSESVISYFLDEELLESKKKNTDSLGSSDVFKCLKLLSSLLQVQWCVFNSIVSRIEFIFALAELLDIRI